MSDEGTYCTHSRCRLPVDMSRPGGVRDDQGRPWHDICLRLQVQDNPHLRQGAPDA